MTEDSCDRWRGRFQILHATSQDGSSLEFVAATFLFLLLDFFKKDLWIFWKQKEGKRRKTLFIYEMMLMLALSSRIHLNSQERPPPSLPPSRLHKQTHPLPSLICTARILPCTAHCAVMRTALYCAKHCTTNCTVMQTSPYCKLYCTALYCTLYCTVLYCTVLYCTVLYTVLPCTAHC